MSLFLTDAGLSSAIAGKTYQAQVLATCKVMKDGGCMIYTYCVLAFEKDQVTVSSYVKASCTSKENEAGYEGDNGKHAKKYKWHTQNNIVYIEGFEEYGNFTCKNETLVASKAINYGHEALVFSMVAPVAKKISE